MSDKLSTGEELGIEPIKGQGKIHFRFHGGSQSRVNEVILLGRGTFVELQKGVEELLENQADAIFYEAGIRSGRETEETLDTELGAKDDELIVKAFLALEEDGLGWFKIKELSFDSKTRRGSVTVFNSFISNTYGKAKKPVCHFIAGFIAGFISIIWDTEIECEETACSSVSGEYCVFEWEAI